MDGVGSTDGSWCQNCFGVSGYALPQFVKASPTTAMSSTYLGKVLDQQYLFFHV